MRISIILIFSAVFTINAATYSQSKRVSLSLTNVSFSKLFEEIRKQTDYSFFFNDEKINELADISVNKTNAPVEEILDEVLKGTDLSYKVVDGVIVIVENGKVIPVQTITVTGTVIDAATNEALPGVNVLVKNSKLGVVTDFDGNFVIKLPQASTLIVSYLGYASQEIVVEGSETIKVKLEPEIENLNEVIINTGYQKIDKRESTSAIATVKEEDLNIAGAISVDKMLEGKAPGLQITNLSSTPGAAAKIRIRGGSTFTGNQSPLWVVDGVIYEDPVPLSADEINSFDNVNIIGNALSGINPSDIAKIDILKDASATAIYGIRAANGVIVITTKRGKTGEPSLTYSANLSFVQAPKYSNFNLMNSKERIDVSREMYQRNLGFASNYDNIDRLGYEGALMNLWDGTYNYQEFQNQVNYLETLNSDWFGELYNNSLTQRHAVSVSGGGDNMKYYFSLGYDDQQGDEKNVDLNRITARSNLDINLKDNVVLGLRMSGSVQKATYNHNSINAFNEAYYTSRTIPIYNEDGSYFYQSRALLNDAYGTAYGGYNILNEMDNSERNINNKSLDIAASLQWDLSDAFRFTSQISYRNTTNLTEEWITENTFYSAKLRTYDAFEDLLDERVDRYSTLPFGGVYSGGMVSQDSYSITNQLNYKTYLDEDNKHNINLNLGQEARSVNYWGATGFTVPGYNHYQGRGFISLPRVGVTTNDDGQSIINYEGYDYDAMINWLTTDGQSVYPSITDRVQNTMSYFGIFSYVYDKRYVLNFNARSDGSNTFGQYERYKFKPAWSASGRWNIHNEKFMENSMTINELALRGSYGVRGTMPNASPYLIIQNYGKNNAVYYPENTASLSSFPNANLRWEKSETVNVGLNYSLFDGRISGALDYAYSKSTDLLQNRPISLVNGSTTQLYNSGSKSVNSFEFAIRTVNLKLKDLSWSTNFNFSYDRDRVLSGFEEGVQFQGLTVNDYLSGSIYRAGFPTNGFFSYQFDGLTDEGLPTFKHLVEPGMTPEQQLEAALVYEGSRTPLYYGGFGTQIKSGNFTISASFTYKLGYKTRLLGLYNGNQNLPLPYENMHGTFVNRWRQPGDEAFTNIPTLSNYNQRFTSDALADGYNNIYVTNLGQAVPDGRNAWWMYDRSDARVVSADHIRFQSLTLSYNVPSKLIEGTGIKHLNLGVQGSNLSFWAFDRDLKGQDPEQVSGVGLPTLPNYSLSLNMSF
ncbi:SusC/RagA family TonB-linked outer membrane protein [Aestuariibaculum lutulentum]|uniref:SusC/RagA family TonB-linked outer membrane protein n=1 Tax=Aestuariibaculum lutulentum TaxID=2920935 RepID=A0ABS9RES6_9FLAO|nr:SusC/RagA family TonB-linked outer membrane protein [Aestuariibaculum lutulentum]MCH4551458.1 SusC/RagA family TonB-linked outer membrane protein [Aestuariibaculum lutulentum]